MSLLNLTICYPNDNSYNKSVRYDVECYKNSTMISTPTNWFSGETIKAQSKKLYQSQNHEFKSLESHVEGKIVKIQQYYIY